MKIKFKKCFVVLLFMICCLICVGCASKVNNAMYIKSEYEHAKWELNGQYYIINTYADLNNLLENESSDKYSAAFFENNSLIIFKIIEDFIGSKSEIKSYCFKGKTIKINVKTIQKGQEKGEEYWWFILELNKVEIKNIEEVKIIKNKKEIMNKVKIDLYNGVREAYWNTFIKSKRQDSALEDVLIHNYLGIYEDSFVAVFLDREDCDFPEMVCHCIVENLDFEYSMGYEILVYDGEKFYKLNEAYSCGILSIYSIREIYKKYYIL